MLDLANPELNWVKIGNGLGIEVAQATTLDQCADLLRLSFKQPSPFLIELVI
jgi:acetolactate synthase-1/2/3 large subunit